jgi:hypothetical protein
VRKRLTAALLLGGHLLLTQGLLPTAVGASPSPSYYDGHRDGHYRCMYRCAERGYGDGSYDRYGHDRYGYDRYNRYGHHDCRYHDQWGWHRCGYNWRYRSYGGATPQP